MYNPDDDGKTHINVYSKGKTELGRLLSNFAHTPFTLSVGPDEFLKFQSVEGYWYWLLTDDDHLCNLYGYQAKQYGKSLLKTKEENVSEKELEKAYRQKLIEHPKLIELLEENRLPLVHYYVFGSKVIVPKEFQWTADLWNKVYDNL